MTTTRVKKKQRRRRRRQKLYDLRQRIQETQSASERQRLIAKIRRISPYAPVPEA
jgi:hypothetical protein